MSESNFKNIKNRPDNNIGVKTEIKPLRIKALSEKYKSKQIIILPINNKLHCHHCGNMINCDDLYKIATGTVACSRCGHPSPLQFHKDFDVIKNKCFICDLIFSLYIQENIEIPRLNSYKLIKYHLTPGIREIGGMVISTGVVI